jgi:hypothetical protein
MKKIITIFVILFLILIMMSCDGGPSGYTIETEVEGNGTITLDPDSEVYDPDTVVTITATPDAGWVFEGWTGSIQGDTNPAELTVNGNEYVKATFSENPSASVTLVFYFDHPSIPADGLFTLAGSTTEDLIELGGDGNWAFTDGTDMSVMNDNLLFPVSGTTIGVPITHNLEAGVYDWAILIDTTPGDDDYSNFWTFPDTEGAPMDQYEFKAGYSYEIRVGEESDSGVGTTYVTETAP